MRDGQRNVRDWMQTDIEHRARTEFRQQELWWLLPTVCIVLCGKPKPPLLQQAYQQSRESLVTVHP